MVENMGKKWKNIYLKLLCFDIIFFLVNGGFMALSDNIDTNGGYGLLGVGVILLIIDAIIALVHGFVSYIKTQSFLKPQLIFIVSSLTYLIVILLFLGKERVTINFCLLYCSLSCCSAFIAMIISKVKKHFASSNKDDYEDQIKNIDGISNENKENSPSKTTE